MPERKIVPSSCVYLASSENPSRPAMLNPPAGIHSPDARGVRTHLNACPGDRRPDPAVGRSLAPARAKRCWTAGCLHLGFEASAPLTERHTAVRTGRGED